MRDNVMARINARSLKEEKQPILGLALIKSPHPTIDHDKVHDAGDVSRESSGGVRYECAARTVFEPRHRRSSG